MLSVVSPQWLPLRDIINYILPTIIFFALFLPIISFIPCFEKFSPNLISIVALSVLFGYIVTPPVQRVIQLHIYPRFRGYSELRDRRTWWETVYTRGLFHILSEREQDYLFLLRSYLEFYVATAFYLFLYFLLNTFLFVLGILTIWPLNILNITTPLIEGVKLPSILLMVTSLPASLVAYQWSKLEYRVLYLQQYPAIAAKYHRTQGGIFCRPFGRIIDEEGRGIECAKITIRDPDTKEMVDETGSKKWGFYKSIKVLPYPKKGKYIIEVEKPGYKPIEEPIEQIFSDKEIEYPPKEIRLRICEKPIETGKST